MPTTTTTSATDRHTDLAAGARAMVPWLVGVVPFGLVIGVSAARANIPVLAGWLTGPLIYAGSAQLATIELLDAGAAPMVAVIAALVINLRLVLYSATMARHWADAPRWWQALAAYLLIDPSLAVGTDGYDTIGDRRSAHLHYIGAGVTLWLTWLVAIAVGATVGARLPLVLQLEMIIPLFLVGDVVHRLHDQSTARAAAIAAVTALVAAPTPLHLGPMVAIGAGVVVAMHAERQPEMAA